MLLLSFMKTRVFGFWLLVSLFLSSIYAAGNAIFVVVIVTRNNNFFDTS